MKLVWGSVDAVESEQDGLQRLTVTPDGGAKGAAIVYLRLVGRVDAGDRVLLNTTAVDLGLGTGGSHFVVCRLGDASGVSLEAPSGGHVMKLRYTPHQVDVLSVEAQESPHHDTMALADSLGGMPVVCCGLHSQVPLVAAAVKRYRPDARVAYCMTDGAALPLELSDLVRESVAVGLLDATVTCGQAFGGMFEAINLHSGLLAARHVAGSDLAVVAIGPGVAGTATPFGHGGIAQGEAVNAVSILGGRPVVCLRVSFADARERHRSVSHHSIAALSKVALAPAEVAVPTLDGELSDAIRAALVDAGILRRHTVVTSAEGSVAPPSLRGLQVTTMGRGPQDDPAFYAAAYAAGDIASRSVP